MFITFEGIDGSGKSTQIARTEAWLRGRGYDVLVSREPGGSELGIAIAALLHDPRWSSMRPRTEFLLFSASRAQLVDELVRPHLARRNAIVILDRYDDSSTAYQGGGRKIGIEPVETVNRFATGGLVPDVTFVLDLDWDTSLQRLSREGGAPDRLEQNARTFFDRVREAYHTLCARHPKRMILLDASQPAEVVFGRIQRELEARL
ncbi:MAG: dTMP kinase [bacterium]|nr:dTMP kinase [bacterium]